MLQEKKTHFETVSEPGIKRLLGEYFHPCEFEQSLVGFSTCGKDWKKEPILVDCGEVLLRVIDAIENCVLLVSKKGGELTTGLGVSQGFDGVFVGALTTNEGVETESFRIRMIGELIVLYSTAILISRYEKEVSKRVLHQCDDSVVEAVERKLRKQRTHFRKQIRPNVSDTVVTIDGVNCEIVSVDLSGSYSRLR